MSQPQEGLFRFSHREKLFLVSTVGSANPEWVLASFNLEEALREQWWHVKEGDIVFDVGAAYGSYTLAACAHGASLVVAWEPRKQEFFDLCQNVTINNWWGKVIPLGIVAGEGDGFGIADFWSVNSSSCRPEGRADRRLACPVDHYVDFLGLKRMDWLKIDVEGAEVTVLRGAMRTVERFKPKILIENHVGFVPDVDKIIRGILQPLGYKEENKQDGEFNGNWSLWSPT